MPPPEDEDQADSYTPYHLMCNGLVERFNTTLKACLCSLCSEQPRQWQCYISLLLFAHRRKTLLANLLKRHITIGTALEETSMGDGSVPTANLFVVEDADEGSSCEVLPELGGWGSKETVKDLKFVNELLIGGAPYPVKFFDTFAETPVSITLSYKADFV
ncbi:Zinc finger protein [Plakobranchus ocellatus]|uniref:Zinc finger protein n=1 Tax=Plakobranchus ocellatus TaxID=259542 RepID=A0AAV3YL50_9GAST|nr:Zinc finger protein [Plakobranchus ocellatus]